MAAGATKKSTPTARERLEAQLREFEGRLEAAEGD